MRGDDNQQEGMFSYISPEKRVPADHLLRPIRKMVDEILKEMSPQFAKLYSEVGRPSIAPERLFRSLLLQIFYSVRSERMLIEQLQYNLLFRWFVGMEMDEEVWNHAVFSKNREKNYNTQEFVRELRGMKITPHVAQNDTNRSSAIDQRTTRQAGYEMSQLERKRVEQSFGWMKMVGMLRKMKLRGMDKVGWLFTFTGAAYNLCRLRNQRWQHRPTHRIARDLNRFCVEPMNVKSRVRRTRNLNFQQAVKNLRCYPVRQELGPHRNTLRERVRAARHGLDSTLGGHSGARSINRFRHGGYGHPMIIVRGASPVAASLGSLFPTLQSSR